MGWINKNLSLWQDKFNSVIGLERLILWNWFVIENSNGKVGRLKIKYGTKIDV